MKPDPKRREKDFARTRDRMPEVGRGSAYFEGSSASNSLSVYFLTTATF